ncbi:MAG: response regulator transcription factor [Chloroflexota bacterium]|nr:response regulator transcription factor [Chloroflexota bacterium]MDE3193146.1 response regulator transcription factor [Chloroflexota bacterium]
MQQIRIFIADDQALFREGLASLIAGQPDMQIVGEASDGMEALERVQELKPDLILMDIRMPRMDGLEATRRIKAVLPEAKIVMLTISDLAQELFEAMRHGAVGYLLKNMKARRLFEEIRGVMRDEVALSPYLAGRILKEFTRQREYEAVTKGIELGLTDREKQVLSLVVTGLSNKEIGGKLSITESTVKRHLHSILEKLHMENRVQAAAYAMRTGLVESAMGERERS